MTLAYDEAVPGKVLSITDGVGRATTLAYNADGQLASITAPGCPVVSYTYDGSAENGWIWKRTSTPNTATTRATAHRPRR